MDGMNITTTARQRLKEAVDAASAAASVASQAMLSINAAAGLVAAAVTDLAPYADLDQRITDYRAGLLKEWATKRIGPAPDTASLPAGLQAEQAAKAKAEARLSAARAAHDALAVEQEVLDTAYREAKQAASVAAAAVIAEEAELMAEEAKQVYDRLLTLRADLEELGRTWLPDAWPGPFHLPGDIPTFLWSTAHVVAPMGRPPAAVTDWRKYHARLLADPETTPGPQRA